MKSQQTARKQEAAKTLLFKNARTETHWVGDGFFVSSLIFPNPPVSSHYDPFVMLDYAAPRDFAPSDKQRGVGEHPHRGFETVTFAIQGEISHRDSGGGGGTITAGGCQWMTAGRGVVHEELLSKSFAKSGGTLEMVQLWVNLPARLKMTQPRYQGVSSEQIPSVELADGVRARVIAGAFQKTKGPCATHTPMNVYDLTFAATTTKQPRVVTLDLPEGTNTLLLVLRGPATIAGQDVGAGEIAVMSREGSQVPLEAGATPARILVLNGQPLSEPMVAHGPFVMNTKQEIEQAIRDYQSGKMGHLGPP